MEMIFPYEMWEWDLRHSITETLVPSVNAFYAAQIMFDLDLFIYYDPAYQGLCTS